jgi:pimeloyl-ACP methyl ester carboxylesterase
MTIFLSHSRVKLAFHTLREGPERPLLLLHGLGENSPRAVPEDVAGWHGGIYALDFTGHGQSSVPAGGGYTAEVLMADADAALGMLGKATVLGRGLGAYVALMLSGGRPEQVRGAILCDGHGLSGGGTTPGPMIVRGVPGRQTAPDPFALVELASDLRPPDYAGSFAELAAAHSGLERPITVCAAARPEWLAEVVRRKGVETGAVAEAVRYYSGRD